MTPGEVINYDPSDFEDTADKPKGDKKPEWPIFDINKTIKKVDKLKTSEFISELEDATEESPSDGEERKKTKAEIKKFAEEIKKTGDINTKVDWDTILAYLLNQAGNPHIDTLIDKLLQNPNVDTNKLNELWETALTSTIYDRQKTALEIDTDAMKKIISHPKTDINALNAQWDTVLLKAVKFLTQNVNNSEAIGDEVMETIIMLLTNPKTDADIKWKDGKNAHDLLKAANPKNKEVNKVMETMKWLNPNMSIDSKQGLGPENNTNK